MMKRVFLFLSTVVTLVYCLPLYGADGGYMGYASYVPRKAISRQSGSSEESIDSSAGSPAIDVSRQRQHTKSEEDSSRSSEYSPQPSPKKYNIHKDSSSSLEYSPQPSPKKYSLQDYVPSRQHGYGNNKITEEDPKSDYHRATLYGQSGGGYKIADTYQSQHLDGHSGSEEDFKYGDDLSYPQPYEYGYALKDQHGNEQHKYETRDVDGTVKGSYGFMDEHGFYRKVEYVADKGGFRASVKTNEPGTESKNPADVHLEAEKLEHK